MFKIELNFWIHIPRQNKQQQSRPRHHNSMPVGKWIAVRAKYPVARKRNKLAPVGSAKLGAQPQKA